MSDYPIKSPRKLIEVALPLDDINAGGGGTGENCSAWTSCELAPVTVPAVDFLAQFE
jgi:hypothetical protein